MFSCKFAAYLRNSCFDEHLWEITSANFYSICLPYFSIQICVKFRLFSDIFLTSSMFYSERAVLCLPEFSLFLFRLVPYERYFIKFCSIVFFFFLFERWRLTKLLPKCCLNCYVAFSFEKLFYNKNSSFF